VDAWVYLAQTYEMMGDTVNAVADYEHYSQVVKDTLVSAQVKDYIRKLSPKNGQGNNKKQ
jgi:hypothetical protein